jgi:hypothetical protein
MPVMLFSRWDVRMNVHLSSSARKPSCESHLCMMRRSPTPRDSDSQIRLEEIPPELLGRRRADTRLFRRLSCQTMP